MKRTMRKVGAKARSVSIKTYAHFESFCEHHATKLLLIMGVGLLAGGLTTLSHAGGAPNVFTVPSFNDGLIRESVALLFALIEGAFGALIMVVAGLGAIVAAAMGAYRAAVGMLVVALGAFILRSLVSLFFGQNFQTNGVTGGIGNRAQPAAGTGAAGGG